MMEAHLAWLLCEPGGGGGKKEASPSRETSDSLQTNIYTIISLTYGQVTTAPNYRLLSKF